MRRDSRCGIRYTAQERAIAVNLRMRGASLSSICARLGCSSSIVHRWVRKAGQRSRAGQAPARPEITGERARKAIREHGSMRAAARALHMSYATFERRANGSVVTG